MSMRAIVGITFLLTVSFVLPDSAIARGKPNGAMCHVSKSCSSGVCTRIHPEDKFGECCAPQDCAELGRQCGSGTDNCGRPLDCSECGPGFTCVNFQCESGTTTTTTTTSTTSSTTSSTSSTTSSTSTSSTSSTTTTSTTSTTMPPVCAFPGQDCTIMPCCFGGCVSLEGQMTCAF
ncbi:MAG TPA: hypothetical protein VN634_19595 [Candidatus Limnocylindrales bacterium]|nr:hypothetical protein [Candidatus Limnocylindrales bacterium]